MVQGKIMAHQVVLDEFERHLNGTASRAFYGHLESCPACQAEVQDMEEVSRMFGDLRADMQAAPPPPLGFYNRVTARIIEQERNEAWGLFSLGNGFFRRLAFASLMILAGLGSYLVTRESSIGDEDPAAIMAQHDPSATHDDGSDRDRMLVTLATYR